MSPQVAVTATGDGPVYSVAAGRLVIDNRSVSGLAYDIELPPATARADLSIRVGNRLVFARQGATVTAESAAGDNGAYVIPMAAIGVR